MGAIKRAFLRACDAVSNPERPHEWGRGAQDGFGRSRAFAAPLAVPPAGGSIAIVRARVGGQVARVIVRPETRPLRVVAEGKLEDAHADRKSTRLNSRHL